MLGNLNVNIMFTIALSLTGVFGMMLGYRLNASMYRRVEESKLSDRESISKLSSIGSQATQGNDYQYSQVDLAFENGDSLGSSTTSKIYSDEHDKQIQERKGEMDSFLDKTKMRNQTAQQSSKTDQPQLESSRNSIGSSTPNPEEDTTEGHLTRPNSLTSQQDSEGLRSRNSTNAMHRLSSASTPAQNPNVPELDYDAVMREEELIRLEYQEAPRPSTPTGPKEVKRIFPAHRDVQKDINLLD